MTETPASWLHDCGCLSLAAGHPAPCVDLAGQCGTWHGLIQVILSAQPTLSANSSLFPEEIKATGRGTRVQLLP